MTTIVVVLRAVRDPSGITVNRKAQKVFVNHERYMINPADRNALEAALQLAGPEDRVTAVAIGGETAHSILQQARATGASRAVWVPAAGVQPLDASAATTVLRHVVPLINDVDLVLLGADVLDGDLAQVGPRLAEALDWVFVGEAFALKAWPDGGFGIVVAGAGGGYRCQGVDTPAVAIVVRDCNQPRFAPAAKIISIYQDQAAIERWSTADLGLDEASLKPLTTVRGESFPPERTLGQLLENSNAVQVLAKTMRGI